MSNKPTQDPSKVSGQFHSAKGTVVETAGHLTGTQSWSQAGKEEHTRGEGEYKAAQAKGYGEGTTDRVGGYKDSVVGSLSGDKSQEAAGNARNTKGQAQQEANKPTFD